MVVTFLFLLPFAGRFGFGVLQIDERNQSIRSTQGGTDLDYPVLPSPMVFTAAAQSGEMRSIGLAAFCILAWPWLTMAGLMVFQASMRKAKVKPVHILRCVIYSADGMICGSLALLGWFIWFNTTPMRVRRFVSSSIIEFTENVLLVLFVVLIYRLWIAYRTYLRFDHALATVVASQIMVGLLVWKIGLDWKMLSWW